MQTEDIQVSGVQSIDRAVRVLAAFTPERPIAGVSDIARLTGMSRSTVHRLLTALAVHGLAQQLADSPTYSLGPRLLSFADTARGHLTLDRQAEPIMTWLRDESGETVGLHVLDATPARRTVAQVESTQALRRTYTDIGAPRPVHQGAPGKVLLAYADEALRQKVLRSKLIAADGETVVPAARLRAELGEIRERGWAMSLQERVVGVVALAVPVYDHTGRVIAALSISIPAARAGREELEVLAPVAMSAGSTLSARLGYGLTPVRTATPTQAQEATS
ncbi:IclR family transcriptional regulator [Saccharopolyspora sp. 5N708]|uniref:IclR family transcriptional regulator n=1 Tax=Saccharopolyspora sp. 5N708 TaxID=3457424 RepID=UPI003FCF349E